MSANFCQGNITMVRRTIVSLLASVLLSVFGVSSQTYAAKEYHYGSGHWSGAAEHSKKTDRFLYCMIAAKYKSGVLLGMGIIRTGELFITLNHERWTLKKGSVGKVTYHVDSHHLGSFQVKVWAPTQMGTVLGQNEWAFKRLQRGQVLRAVAPQETFEFDLTGTHDALRKTQDCVNLQLALERGTANPFATSAANPFATRSSRTYSKRSSYTATKSAPGDNAAWRDIIKLAGGSQIKFISLEKSLRDGGFKYAWHVDNTFGFVGQWKPDGDVNAMMSQVFAFLDGNCKGKYGYGTKEPKSVGRYSFKEGFSICEEEGKTISTFATGVVADKTFTFIGHSSSAKYQENAKLINDGMLRVVSALIDRGSR